MNPRKFKLPRRVSWATGVAMLAVGLVLLSGVGLYYGYGIYAHSNLDRLNVSAKDYSPPKLAQTNVSAKDPSPPKVARTQGSVTETQPLLRSDDSRKAAKLDPAPVSQPQSNPSPAAAEVATPALAASSYGSIYPGVQMHPKYWDRPMWAGTDRYSREERGLPDGYVQVSASDGGIGRGTLPNARRIIIPAIGVDSAVNELQILDLGDSLAYETPKRIVGHTPDSSNPGELGNGWFFAHLESPIQREGSVFRRLPEIPKHLKTGDPVYVTLTSERGEYLYQVTETRLIPQDELTLYDSGDATITLVTCYPRLYYDHRFLVTAQLVGLKS